MKGWGEKEGEREWGERESYSLHKEPIGCISSLTHSPHPAESDFWPKMLSREQRGYQKSDPGGDHYYVCYLGETHVLLPE